MKKKVSRRRIDVNVDELDRIIEAAMRAPLNEADGRTLKTPVHAMAERLVRRRNTEKTSAVLEPKPHAAVNTPEPEKQAAAAHGRDGASAFTGANTRNASFGSRPHRPLFLPQSGSISHRTGGKLTKLSRPVSYSC
jgi:hypothetical protein